MSEFKDPKIKLFGKTIQLPDSSAAAAAAVEAASVENGESVSGESGEAAGEDSSNQSPSCTSDSMSEDSNLNRDAEEEQSPESLSDPPKQDHPKGESKDSIHTQPIIEDSNEASDTTSNSQQDKTLKKPDKIIPCPRCNSMETKFCYFNNYNVNQPRHFCKNCQRYWTAGGTMRNVPVGAGRRKNKNSTPQFRHLIVPEALPNGGHHSPTLNPNATLLTFGSDSPTPLCESMSSVLHITNGPPHKPEEQRDADVANKTGLPELMPNYHPFPPGGPLPYPWNPVQWAPHVPPPGMRFPVPFYPTPYWACPVPGPWNVPWVIPPPSCGPASPTLGKHAREENLPEASSSTEEGRSEKSLWFPKTLRIDDHGEAAKSSIWATLGLKNDGVDSVVGGGLFKAFVSQSKGDEEKSHVSEASAVLQANPAAFSRSAIFHETS
ncbi:hypothetical protein ABFS83_08G024000 [Erythranthe nasuta]